MSEELHACHQKMRGLNSSLQQAQRDAGGHSCSFCRAGTLSDGQRTTRLQATLTQETAMRGLAPEASLQGGQQGMNGLSTAGLAHKGRCLPRQGLLSHNKGRRLLGAVSGCGQGAQGLRKCVCGQGWQQSGL